jgi:chemotaxis protein histidine kinase CheA
MEVNMTNDRKEWSRRLPQFLVEAESLLARSEECLSHLQLISNDKDAIDCILSTLLKLASKADALALAAVSEFSLHVHGLLNHAQHQADLHDQALSALKDCFTLMAWQLELIDERTGKLALDDSEQTSLIEALAFHVGHGPFQLPAGTRPFTRISFMERQA